MLLLCCVVIWCWIKGKSHKTFMSSNKMRCQPISSSLSFMKIWPLWCHKGHRDLSQARATEECFFFVLSLLLIINYAQQLQKTKKETLPVDLNRLTAVLHHRKSGHVKLFYDLTWIFWTVRPVTSSSCCSCGYGGCISHGCIAGFPSLHGDVSTTPCDSTASHPGARP